MSTRTNLKIRSVIVALVLITAAPTFAGSIIHVDADADGANNGSSWANAYHYLQNALTAALSGDEIRVAQGVYKPDQGAGITPGDRYAAFQLINDVTIKGGYAGFGEPEPNARDIEMFETILSGDLNGDDVEVGNPEDLLDEPTRAENSYHLVFAGYWTDETAVLDGFTITGGNADGSYPNDGGAGMRNSGDSSPTLANCTFTRNSSADWGGAVYNRGGLILTNCVLTGNSAGYGGGAIRSGHTYSLTMTIINCVISGNTASEDGGGIYNWESDAIIVNSKIIENSAHHRGGGIYMDEDSSMALTGCTFSRNKAAGGDGGGLYSRWYSYPLITNCIFWENSDVGGVDESAQVTGSDQINYSCIQGWTGILGGMGNIGNDPLFVDPNNDDYHLLPGSPCINTGDPNYVPAPGETDLDGKPRIVGGTVDMGVYEFGCPRILYVDADATGANDGSSWANAYNYLQDALAAAVYGDKIHVAQGIYKPDQGGGITPGDREATFQLKNGVAIKGSYTGFGQPDPNARNIELYETILTGDLNGDDGPNFANNAENSYHVVTGSDTDTTAVLEGFTITGGNANNPGLSWPYVNSYGAGMYNSNGSPVLTNCTFTGNCAEGYHGYGGGMCNRNSNPTLTKCTFSRNSAYYGGGMWNTLHSGPILTHCIFIGNSATNCGGGMGNDQVNIRPILKNCLFSGNSASNLGGGIYNDDCGQILTNCTFSGNSAGNSGGGIFNDENEMILTNCIFWGNSDSGGMDQSAQLNEGDDIEINYCCIQGWTGNLGGIGNIDPEPLFVDADSGDYHLLPGSPCINAGDPDYEPEPGETDLDGRPRVIGGRIDMGAFEYPPRDLYVDDDASNDPGPGNPDVSDPMEDGTQAHPFDAIQEAIDAAWDSDTVIVLDGTYTGTGNRDIDFKGRAITVRSENGPETCIIDCQATRAEPHRGFKFHSGEDEMSVLDGLTITGGYILGTNGGAIRCDGSSPTITNNIITHTVAEEGGGIACMSGSSPTIAQNRISDNWTSDGGGGIECCHSSPRIINNIITNNYDGGIYIRNSGSPTVAGNLIVGNTGQGGIYLYWGDVAATITDNTIVGNSGGILSWAAHATITNCILWDNSDDLGGCSATYSCIQDDDQGEGNIHSNPLFVDPNNDDYHLLPGSPCIDAGDPDYIAEPNETDLDGKPRVIGGRIDMGAYEYSPTIPAEARILPRTINLTSKGKWITAYIWLPEDYTVADIDPNSIFLEDEIQPEQFSVDQQKQVATATFDREKVQSILNVGDVELTITGRLMDGTSFKATDIIKVTSQKPPK